jgi:hypothetical protein
MSRTLRNMLGGLTVVAVVVVGQVAAQAARHIHIPGTSCRPRKADVSKIQLGNQSAVNESSSSATVACPVTYQDNPAGSDPNGFIARVIDRSSGSDITCTLFVFAELSVPTGGQLFQSARSSSGSSGSLQTLSFTVPNPDLAMQMFTMTCTLPGAGSSSTRSEVFDYTLTQEF